MLGWGAVLILALLFLGPIGALFAQLDSAAFRETISSASLSKVLGTTLISGLGGAALSVGLGLFFARAFAGRNWRGRRPQRLLLLMPYLVPNFVLASAYVVAWNPTTGLLNSILRFPFGLYGLGGMTFLFAVSHVPVAFLLCENRLTRIDSSLREAARLSGASSAMIFRKIELPLLRPTLAAAIGLCFSLNISAFAIPAWIGAPARAYPLTYKIYQAIQVGGADGLPAAATYALMLLGFALPPLALAAWANRNERIYTVVTGKASKASTAKPSRRSFIVFQLVYWATQLTFFAAPLGALLVTTLVPPGCLQSQGSACFAQASFKTYRYVLFELAETRAGLHGSLVYGTISAALIMALVLLTLALLSRRRSQLRAAEWIFALPVATPGAIIALGLIVSYSGRFWVNLYNTAWIVVLAFVIKHLNLAFQPVRDGLNGLSGSLFEAARLSGARTAGVWRHIVLPLLAPEILGGAFLVLIPILGELTMSIFLTSPAFRSIGTVLFDLQDYADQSSAAALSILLVLLILIVNEAARLLSGRKLGY